MAFLLVQPNGSKLWRYAYRFHGKQKTLSLGSYPLVSLRDARTKRDEARELLTKDIDPGEKLKADKLQRIIQSAITFTHVADEFVEKMELEGKAPVTLTKKKWLLDMAKADFGRKPIHEIKAPEILQTLKRLRTKVTTKLPAVFAQRSVRSSVMVSPQHVPIVIQHSVCVAR